jgi:hypothetical protein
MKMLYLHSDRSEIVEWQGTSSDGEYGFIVVKGLVSGLMWYTTRDRLVALTPLMEALC